MRHFTSKLITALGALATAAAAQATAMSAWANASVSLPTLTTALTAGEAVKAGDLIVQGGDGAAYWANDPNLPGASGRPTYLAADTAQANAAAPILGMAGTGVLNQGTPAVLSNGNVVVATFVPGTNAAYAVFSIYTQSGALVAGPIQSGYSMGTGVANCLLTIAPLPAGGTLPVGGFVLGLGGGNQGFPALELYDNLGNKIGATVQLETVTQRSYYVSVTPTPAGGVAAAWYTNPGLQVKLAVFDQNLAQQGGTAVVGTSAGPFPSQYQYQEALRAVTLATGNIGVVWVDGVGSVGGGTVYRAVYSPTLAVVVANTATGIAITGGSSTSLQSLSAVATAGSGLAIGYAVGLVGKVAKFADGALIGAVQTVTAAAAATNGVCLRLVALPAGGVFWAWSAANSNGTGGLTYWGAYDTAMAQLVAPTPLNIGGTTTSGYNYVYPMLMPNGEITVLADYATTAMYGVRLGLVNGAWAQKDTGTPLTLAVTYGPGNYGIGLGNTIPTTGAVVLTDALSTAGNAYALTPQKNSGSTGIALNIVNAFVQRRSTVGVAANDATKGAPVTVQTLGPAPTRLTFTKPFVADQTAAAIPGQKMSVVGNKALMRGIQAA